MESKNSFACNTFARAADTNDRITKFHWQARVEKKFARGFFSSAFEVISWLLSSSLVLNIELRLLRSEREPNERTKDSCQEKERKVWQ